MKYRLTATAKQDIRDIVSHIRTAQKSPQNARLVVERLRAQFRKLADSPGIGHVRAELRDEAARVVSVTGLLVIYDPTPKPVTILRVVHGARDLSGVRARRFTE